MACLLFFGWRAVALSVAAPSFDGLDRAAHSQQVASTRVLVVVIAAVGLFFAAVHIKRLRGVFGRFFSRSDGPTNIAILRIVIFTQLLLVIDKPGLLWFAHFPQIFRDPPLGLSWANTDLFFDERLIAIAYGAFFLFCIGAIVGLFTRTCCIMTTLLVLYLLGIPHFDGKVDHGTHHLVWFSALLCTAPCADVLSLDALRRAWAHERGVALPDLSPSRAYALPVSFAWLLLGTLYFFPGFWKLWTCGIYWALSDNVKFHMYNKWSEMGGWIPSFRIDHYSVLYRAGGMATIVFELGFLFCVLWPLGRAVAWVGGVTFSVSNGLLLNIHFRQLRWSYAALIDWQSVFHWIGRRAFSAPLHVRYDGRSVSACRFVGVVRSLDVLGRLKFDRFDGAVDSSKGTRAVGKGDAIDADSTDRLSARTSATAVRCCSTTTPTMRSSGWCLRPFPTEGKPAMTWTASETVRRSPVRLMRARTSWTPRTGRSISTPPRRWTGGCTTTTAT
ncbi:MAG: hypothetical protein IID33_05755 [Planctomycetes bacterium]|nr:hypothetical protein [Planctomycetota bacterium]